jgi:hypothetical protein
MLYINLIFLTTPLLIPSFSFRVQDVISFYKGYFSVQLPLPHYYIKLMKPNHKISYVEKMCTKNEHTSNLLNSELQLEQL